MNIQRVGPPPLALSLSLLPRIHSFERCISYSPSSCSSTPIRTHLGSTSIAVFSRNKTAIEWCARARIMIILTLFIDRLCVARLRHFYWISGVAHTRARAHRLCRQTEDDHIAFALSAGVYIWYFREAQSVFHWILFYDSQTSSGRIRIFYGRSPSIGFRKWVEIMTQ